MIISDLNYIQTVDEREVCGGAKIVFSWVTQSNTANQAAFSLTNSVNAIAALSGNSLANNTAVQTNSIG